MVIMSLSDSLPLKGVTLFLFSSECNGKNSPHRNYLLGDSPHRLAVLASVEVQHGWLPGWGGMTRLRRLIGEPRAKELVLMCEKINAEHALEMGLLTRIIRKSGQEDELEQFLDHLVKLDPDAYRLAKYALMDERRTTMGTDVQFDILAMKQANTKAD